MITILKWISDKDAMAACEALSQFDKEKEENNGIAFNRIAKLSESFGHVLAAIREELQPDDGKFYIIRLESMLYRYSTMETSKMSDLLSLIGRDDELAK